MPQNLDSKYTIEVLSRTGSLIADFSGRAKERKIDMVRNGSHGAEWTVDLDTIEKYARDVNLNARSLFSEGQNRVVIRRLGTPIMGGELEYTQGDLGEEKTVSVRVIGMLDRLAKKQTSIEKIFLAGTDIGAASWEAIDDAQMEDNGSFGITQGTLQDCPDFLGDVLYEFKNIKDFLQELSSRVNGFDFEFTWDNKYNVYYPRMGVERTELDFTYPGNIKNIKPSRDASTIINYAIVRGQGVDGLLYTTSQDDDSMAAYGRRETVLDFPDIPDIDTLQALGDAQIALLKDPLDIIEVVLDGNRSPFIGSYVLGDTVKVNILDSVAYAYVAGDYRIDEIHIEIDDEDNEDITLKLTR